jgi:putative heme iron utilization protein
MTEEQYGVLLDVISREQDFFDDEIRFSEGEDRVMYENQLADLSSARLAFVNLYEQQK